MDKAEYEKLLDRAYEDLPQMLRSKSRFEVPEVSGKFIKNRTQITNFANIAKHFARENDHFFKFFLKEVGVRGDLDQRDNLILHTKIQPTALNKVVKRYFDMYVSCSHCGSPDTALINDGTVIKCAACGHQEKVPKL